jgi:hypothetical protein
VLSLSDKARSTPLVINESASQTVDLGDVAPMLRGSYIVDASRI